MEYDKLAVDLRTEKGKGAAGRLRRLGKLPGVLYGSGKNYNISLNPKIIYDTLLKEGGKNKIFVLSGSPEVETKMAMIKEYQIDPVSRKLLHVDLYEVSTTQKIVVNVPFNFTGIPIGVSETGGVMSIVVREISLRCFPDKIPKHIDVDVSNLKIGDSIHLDSVILPPDVEKTIKTNPTIVTVVPPAKEEELQPSLAESVEPEVITEKKAAEEEGEEEAEEPKKQEPEAKATKTQEKKKE